VTSDEIERAQEMASRAAAAQREVDELGFGAEIIKPLAPVYIAAGGLTKEGHTDLLGARWSLKGAIELCEARAVADADVLLDWTPLASGTWIARVKDSNAYYEVLSLRVLP
jgi:hypothetical protein